MAFAALSSAASGLGSLLSGFLSVMAGAGEATGKLAAAGRTIRQAGIGAAFAFGSFTLPILYPTIVVIGGALLAILSTIGTPFLKAAEPFRTIDGAINVVDYTAGLITKRVPFLYEIAYALLLFFMIIIYYVVAVMANIFEHWIQLVVLLFFTFTYMYIEAYPAMVIQYFQIHLNTASYAVNTGTATFNVAAGVHAIFLPAMNANFAMSAQSFLTFKDFYQSQSTGGVQQIGEVITSLASLTVAFNALELLIVAFGLQTFLPVLPEIAGVFEFFIERTSCFGLGLHNGRFGPCSIVEYVQFYLVQPLDDIVPAIPLVGGALSNAFGLPLDISCTAQELSIKGAQCGEPGAFSAQCTGTVDDFTRGGFFHKGCPLGARRVLCEVSANETCESVDGEPVSCGASPETGCPHARRALSSRVGHLQNAEDLEVHGECYFICLDHSALFYACLDSWEFRGHCNGTGEAHPEPGRRVLEMFPSAAALPVIVLADNETRRDLLQVKSKEQRLKEIRAAVPQPKFVVGGQECDVSRPASDMAEQMVNMDCMVSALYAAEVRPTPRARRDAERRTMDDVFDSALQATALARSRRLQYMEGQGAMHMSRATDKWPILAKLENIRQTYRAMQTAPRFRRELGGTNTITTPCADQTMVFCCSGGCKPAGSTCPQLDPLSWVQSWCQGVVNAGSTVQNFQIQQAYDSFENCWRGYENYPETFPLSPYVTSPVYCWPMSGEFTFRFAPLNLNFQTWLTQKCTQSTELSCDCPWYWNAEFDYLQNWFPPLATVSMESRITNFFIVSQYLISLLTQQGAPLEIVGYAWYAIFSPWHLFPQWWNYMFLRRLGYTTSGQEEMCAVLHGGSFFYTAFLIYLIYLFILPAVPVMQLVRVAGVTVIHNTLSRRRAHAE